MFSNWKMFNVVSNRYCLNTMMLLSRLFSDFNFSAVVLVLGDIE